MTPQGSVTRSPVDPRARGAPQRGLTSEQANRRLEEQGHNELPRARRPALGTRLVRELREPMALLLTAAAIVSGVALGEVIEAAAIVTIVVINAVIALLQEGRAERALEALDALEAPHATVLRDGHRRIIEARQLVRDDVVLVSAGDRIPADLDVLEASGLEIDEAVLTGESLPVSKRRGGPVDGPIGERGGRLHSGTMTTRGSGTGVVVATGLDTELGSIARQLHQVRREPTPLQRQLGGLTRRLGAAAVVVAAGTFGLLLLVDRGAGTDEAFLTAVALAVAAVPEGLAAVTTVALALGVGRMAQRGAIVRRLPAVETLGATDVLVIDKTGTVTENRMQLSAVIDVDGRAWGPDDLPLDLLVAAEPVMVLCNDATVDPPTGDPTERALLDLTHPAQVEPWRDACPRLGGSPFTSERRRMSTLHRLDGQLTLFVKGAPEAVITRCSQRLQRQTIGPLTDSERDRLLTLASRRAGTGERVLALASRPLLHLPADADQVQDQEHDLVLLALVSLRDPPRTSARASVRAVRAAGVTLLMATGDHPETAAAIAREVGLADTRPLTGAELRANGIPEDPTTVLLYARVDPDQKLDLVERLQTRGHTVAMTGDGVNDAPALQRADIGVALGATGSDVAREAADLVITDDDLGTIVAAIREGRGIYDNLRKVVDYLVSSNLAEVAVVISTLLVLPELGVPLFPLQLLWINLLTDGLPALALGVDPVTPGLMQQPPRSATSRLLGAVHLRGLATRALVLAAGAMAALLAARHVFAMDAATSRTVLFSTLVVAQILYAFVVRMSGQGEQVHTKNRWLVLASVGAVFLHVLILHIPAAQGVFDTVAPPAAAWGLIAAGGLAAPLAIAAGVRVTRRRRPAV